MHKHQLYEQGQDGKWNIKKQKDLHLLPTSLIYIIKDKTRILKNAVVFLPPPPPASSSYNL